MTIQSRLYRFFEHVCLFKCFLLVCEKAVAGIYVIIDAMQLVCMKHFKSSFFLHTTLSSNVMKPQNFDTVHDKTVQPLQWERNNRI